MKTTILLIYLVGSLQAQTVDRPLRSVTDPGVITTRQTITPAGVPTVFKGKVSGVTFGKSADELWVLSATQLYQMNWRTNEVVSNIAHGGLAGFLGVAFRDRAYISAVIKQKSSLLMFENGVLTPVARDLGVQNAGGLSLGGGLAVVPITAEDKAAVIELQSGKTRGFVPTGIAPFAAAVNSSGTFAYVSNWGGRIAGDKDLTAKSGASRVVVNAQGIASTGSVTRIDLKTLLPTHTIATELHPNGLAWHEPSSRLYVANNNRDSVTVIDTDSQAVVKTIKLAPFAVEASGIAPTAIAVSGDGAMLYVACGGINAVAVIDTKSYKLQGLIPAGWYPNAVSLSPDGKYLAIGSLLGAGSGSNADPKQRFVHANRGMVNVVELPDAAQLLRYSVAVSENNRLPLAGTAVPPMAVSKQAKAVPARAGDPSLIEHVVYIVKENRTYDQLFGDISKGNGEPEYTMFGRDVTPNQHRLAEDFVLLDNFYATGGNSADGHQWVTQANEVAYTMWPGYQNRSYPFDGADPIAIAQGGTIWDAALKAGKSVRIYGEYAGSLNASPFKRVDLLKRWKSGADFTSEFSNTAPIAHMNAFLAHNYPAYTTAVPDVIRAQIFLKDLAQWESDGKMPNLAIAALPSDHTYGTAPGLSSPKAMAADNDLAVGLIVEALTKSRFWSKMAIFIVEDDAQGAVDHVDGHRTVALVVSPYIRRGAVDSTFYSSQSMLKTMELMLGLAPLSMFDLIANDMRAGFADKAVLSPFSHIEPKHDLMEVNPAAKALNGAARSAALASAKMRWDVPDAAPSERLNRILWHSVKGWDVKYPKVRQAVFSPYSLDVDDEDRR